MPAPAPAVAGCPPKLPVAAAPPWTNYRPAAGKGWGTSQAWSRVPRDRPRHSEDRDGNAEETACHRHPRAVARRRDRRRPGGRRGTRRRGRARLPPVPGLPPDRRRRPEPCRADAHRRDRPHRRQPRGLPLFDAMVAKGEEGLVWDEETLAPYLENGQPRIGMVSLGCPKALVDSERILTRLRAEGYAISPDYAGADAVIVNTCGFLDSAKAESLEAIGEALAENGRVIVTGCLGADEATSAARAPRGARRHRPAPVRAVLDAVHAAVPPQPRPVHRPDPAAGRPPDAAPLRLSEDLRGLQPQVPLLHHPLDARPARLSRPAHAVLREAEKLVEAGCASCWSSARTPPPTASTAATTATRGRTARCAPTSPTSRARSAGSAPGCGCTTSTPTRMCAT
jgi:hypothetical protein